jgi:hypothetical protein
MVAIGKIESLYLSLATMGISMEVPHKMNYKTTTGSSYAIPRYISEGVKVIRYTTYTCVYCDTTTIVRLWNHFKCPSVGEWI